MKRRGRKRKYDWETWLSCSQTTLVRGVDYHCSQQAMAKMVRNSASNRQVYVQLTDTGNSIIIKVIDAVPHTDKTAVAV